jgi:hypothetical protein
VSDLRTQFLAEDFSSCRKQPDLIIYYLFGTGYFKRQVILKQQFTIKKGYYDPLYNTPYSEPDGLRISIIADCSSAAQNC